MEWPTLGYFVKEQKDSLYKMSPSSQRLLGGSVQLIWAHLVQLPQWPISCLRKYSKRPASLCPPLCLTFWGSLLLKPTSQHCGRKPVMRFSSITLSSPPLKAPKTDAVTTSSGKEFHGLITHWIKKHYLLSALMLPTLTFNRCLLVVVLCEREKSIPPSTHIHTHTQF